MLTVLESVKLSADYLEKKGIESPRLNAELLLSEILKCKRLDLYLKFDQPLKEHEIVKYRDWISRRGKFEPLQYITGKVEFFGLTFNVTPDVLIPRPETELLVEEIIKLFGGVGGLKIIDIGTGSGNIPVALAKNLSDAEITAVDVSEKAITVAVENSRLNGVEEKIEFIHSDFNQLDFGTDRFDILVSNPPYISADEYPTLQTEITKYEPSIALTDAADGLNFYRTITAKSNAILKTGGKIFLELGQGQHDKVEVMLRQNNFSDIKIIKDYQQIERVITGELK